MPLALCAASRLSGIPDHRHTRALDYTQCKQGQPPRGASMTCDPNTWQASRSLRNYRLPLAVRRAALSCALRGRISILQSCYRVYRIDASDSAQSHHDRLCNSVASSRFPGFCTVLSEVGVIRFPIALAPGLAILPVKLPLSLFHR